MEHSSLHHSRLQSVRCSWWWLKSVSDRRQGRASWRYKNLGSVRDIFTSKSCCQTKTMRTNVNYMFWHFGYNFIFFTEHFRNFPFTSRNARKYNLFWLATLKSRTWLDSLHFKLRRNVVFYAQANYREVILGSSSSIVWGVLENLTRTFWTLGRTGKN